MGNHEGGRICLTKCASAAGPQAGARTDLRFLSGAHGGAARAAPRADAARRLHARVRGEPAPMLVAQALREL